MTQGERIKEVRKALGLPLDRFGERIGVKKSALSKVENGLNGLSGQLATSICREFNVNPDYLAGESEEMFIEMSRSDELAAFFGDVLKDDDEDFRKRFISALAQFTEEDWKLFEKIFDKMAKEKD